MPKFEHQYAKRYKFKEWCDYWFGLGKYVRRVDWKPTYPSISNIREFKTGDSGNLKMEKYIYFDAVFVGECLDGDLSIITTRDIQKCKWVIDDPMEELFVKR